jgi:hypothetical protein
MSNLSVWHRSRDYRVNIRTNSRGIRSDREIPYAKPPGVYRILGLGDSFALGYEVDVEDTYLFQLEKKLNERQAGRVEVINLAVSGFGTAEELITLKAEGFKYSPDLVLLGYFVNDVENNIMSDLYKLSGDTLARASATYLPATGLQEALFSIPGYRYLAENSELLNIFRNTISYKMQRGLYEKNRGIEASRLEAGSKAAPADSSVASYESSLTAALLDEIYSECSKRNIPLLVLNIPMATMTSKEMFSNLPFDRMRCARDIILVDARDIFAPYHRKREIQWERWHGHWRPWANHLVASVLADTVEKYLPPPTQRPVMVRSN